MAEMTKFGRLTVTEIQAKKIIGHSIFLASHYRVNPALVNEVIFQLKYGRTSELLWTGAKITYCALDSLNSVGEFLIYGYAYDFSDVRPVMEWINNRK